MPSPTASPVKPAFGPPVRPLPPAGKGPPTSPPPPSPGKAPVESSSSDVPAAVIEEDPDALPPGSQLDNYKLLRELGRGGMGVVYEAENVLLERKAAVKLLSAARAGSARAVERFLREARILAKLDQRDIVGVYDVGRWKGGLYIAMELVRGGSADVYLERRGAFDWREGCRIAAAVCRALSAAHAAGVLHRDIKPANILRSADGQVKLTDFGLARQAAEDGAPRLTVESKILGTPNYLSPEQARCRPLDARTDVYALGATLYHLVTGKAPFEHAGDGIGVITAHLNEAPADPRVHRPAIPAGCSEIILRALAKQPDDRYQTADAMREALEALLAAGGRHPATDGATVPAEAGDVDDWSRFVSATATQSRTMTGAFPAQTLPGSRTSSTVVPRPTGAARWVMPLSIGAAALGIVAMFVALRPKPAAIPADGDAPAAQVPADGATPPTTGTGDPVNDPTADPVNDPGTPAKIPEPAPADPLAEEFARHIDAAGKALRADDEEAVINAVDALRALHARHADSPDPRARRFAAQALAAAESYDKPAEAGIAPEVRILPHRGRARFAAFSPDGHMLAIAGDDRVVKLWKFDTRPVADKPAHESIPLDAAVRSLCFPHGAGGPAVPAGETITFLDAAARCVRTLPLPVRPVTTVPMPAADGGTFWCAGAEGAVLQCATSDGSVRRSLPSGVRAIAALAALPDGRGLLVAGEDGTLRLVSTGDPLPTGAIPKPGRLNRLTVSADSLRWAGSTDTEVAVGEVRSDGPHVLWKAAGRSPVAFSSDSRTVARIEPPREVKGRRTKSVVFHDAATGVEQGRLDLPGTAYALSFHPTGRWLAVAGWNGVRLWDLRLACIPSSFRATGIPAELSFMDMVRNYRNGSPPASDKHSKPAAVLGPPDGDADLSLGRKGEVVFRLVGRVLIDGPGDDLCVFEVGDGRGGADEACDVSISIDGSKWRTVGRHPGGFRGMDISAVAKPGEAFRYIRLVDATGGGGTGSVGADIGGLQILNAAPAAALGRSFEAYENREGFLLEVDSGAPVTGGPTAATMVELSEATRILQVQTLHARGARPGTIALVGADKRVYGPWPATGLRGLDGTADAVWAVHPGVVLPAGRYTVQVSDPAGWSHNGETGGRGACLVRGFPATRNRLRELGK